MISNDRVSVTTVVRTDPQTAFRLFTGEVDLWWKRSSRFRLHGGLMRLDADGLWEGETKIGRTLDWQPGARLLIESWTWTFRPGEHTEVEVRFEPIGDGTRVTVEHRGWAPRERAGEFRTVVGLWWATLLPGIQQVVRGYSV